MMKKLDTAKIKRLLWKKTCEINIYWLLFNNGNTNSGQLEYEYSKKLYV